MPPLTLNARKKFLLSFSWFVTTECCVFDVGASLLHQLTLIVNILGSPDVNFVSLAHADRIKDFLLRQWRDRFLLIDSLTLSSHDMTACVHTTSNVPARGAGMLFTSAQRPALVSACSCSPCQARRPANQCQRWWRREKPPLCRKSRFLLIAN